MGASKKRIWANLSKEDPLFKDMMDHLHEGKPLTKVAVELGVAYHTLYGYVQKYQINLKMLKGITQAEMYKIYNIHTEPAIVHDVHCQGCKARKRCNGCWLKNLYWGGKNCQGE